MISNTSTIFSKGIVESFVAAFCKLYIQIRLKCIDYEERYLAKNVDDTRHAFYKKELCFLTQVFIFVFVCPISIRIDIPGVILSLLYIFHAQ